MRLPVLLVCLVLLANCTPGVPVEPARPDQTKEIWYSQGTEQLVKLAKDAESELNKHRPDAASALITEGQPLINRLLAVPNPTLEAMAAASDLDQIYATMLLTNHHFGWARLLFQKNQARWRNWKPQTPETEKRKAVAEAGMAACDKQLAR